MSDLDPNADPKFEQPQHEKYGVADEPKPEPRQIGVTPGTLVIFKTSEAGKTKLLAGKLVSGEGDTLLVLSGANRYQVPLASVVQLLERQTTGHALLLDSKLCHDTVESVKSTLNSLRTCITEQNCEDSEEREFKGEYNDAIIAQHRLNALKQLLKIVNIL